MESQAIFQANFSLLNFLPAAPEDVNHFDLVAFLVLGLEYLDPQVSPGGLWIEFTG